MTSSISLNNVFLALLYLFVFSIGAQGYIRFLPNVLLPLLSVFSLYFLFAERTLREKIKKDISIYLLSIVPIYLLIKYWMLGGVQQESAMISRYAIPLLIVLCGYKLEKKEIHNLLRVFVLSVFLMTIISLYRITNYYFEFENLPLSTGKLIDDLIVGGRVYLSYSIVISYVISLYFFFRQQDRLYKFLFLGASLIFLFFILLIASRLALLLIVISTIYFLVTILKVKQMLFLLLGLSFVIGLTFALNPNLSNRFLYKDKRKDFVANFKQWEPRFVIWKCNMELLESEEYNWFFGFQSSEQIENSLVECYPTKIENNKEKVAYFLRERFNSHNQYFDLLFFGGVILFILFITLFIYFFTTAHNRLSLVLLFCLVAMFAFENLFHRQYGVYLVGFVFLLIKKNLGCLKLKKEE